MAEGSRATWARLSDEQLLAQCDVDTYRASGPGGQKRNKTSSAVRLRHPPTGLIVIAEESRSQHENKARALSRLRQALFLHLRDDLPAESRTPDAIAAHPDYRDARDHDVKLNMNAKNPRFWPAVGVTPSGNVYMSAYAADVVSPWQTCKTPATPTAVGRINCLLLGNYVHNARLDYFVTDLTTGITQTVTTNPINSRHGFGGGFIGDYTGLAVGSDNAFHAVWTDTNNRQSVTWWFGFEFVPTTINQQDIVTASGTF